jgi:hypothetical protein
MKNTDSKSQIESRLAQYGAMAAVVATGFIAPAAQAGSIVFVDTSASSNNSTAGGAVYFNPSTGTFGGHNSAGATFTLTHAAVSNSGIENEFRIAGASFFVSGSNSKSQLLVKKFNANDVIGPGPTPTKGSTVIVGASSAGGGDISNFGGGPAYIGLYEGGHYGWAEVNIVGGFQGTLLGFAYDTTAGESIKAGQTSSVSSTPEPSSLALLALGSAGIAAWRRRKTADAKA